MPRADTSAINAHLAEIAKTVAPSAHAVLVMDRAGWHGSSALPVLDILIIVTLPPYAPELNPVEKFSAYLRKNRDDVPADGVGGGGPRVLVRAEVISRAAHQAC